MRLRPSGFLGLVLAALAALVAAGRARGAGPPEPGSGRPDVVFALGRFDAIRGEKDTRVELGARYRLDMQLLMGFTPEVGLAITTEGGVFVHAGSGRDFPVWRLNLRPSFCVAAYHGGSGKDLGSTLQFRSAMEISARIPGAGRLGIEIYHLSNASLYRSNPGEESIVMTYAVPLSVFLGSRRNP